MAGTKPWTYRLTRLSAHAKLLVLVMLLAVLAVIALGALGWGLLRESRAFDSEIRRRQDTAGDQIAAMLRSSLHRWQTIVESSDPARVDSSTGALAKVELPDETLLVTFDAGGIRRTRGVRLAYVPAASTESPSVASVFAATEDIEYRDPLAAAGAYRELSRSADANIRANALIRLAGMLRASRPREALTIYTELLAMSDATVAGHPAELVARRERMRLLTTLGDSDASEREAGLLTQALAEGRFVVDRETRDFYVNGLDLALRQSLQQGVRGSAAERLAQLWPQLMPQTTERANGTASVGAMVMAFNSNGDGMTTALIGSIDSLVDNTRTASDISFALQDRNGTWVLGKPMASDDVRVVADPSLPWTIHVGLPGTATTRRALMSSTRVLTLASALMVAALAIAGGLAFRAVRSELDVARRQSEFVAAVSHEFRTPLAAMCHLSEMLEDGGTPPERLPLYFKPWHARAAG